MGINTNATKTETPMQTNKDAFNVNLSGVEPVQGGGFVVLPNDKYNVEIIKSEAVISKKGNPMLKNTLCVRDDPEHDGSLISDYLTYVPGSKYALGRMVAFFEAAGVTIPKGNLNLQEIAKGLKGNCICVQTQNKTEMYNEEKVTRTNVIAYLPYQSATGATGNEEL